MSDVTRRYTAWKAKVKPQRVKDTLDDLQPDMDRRYQAALVRLVSVENKVREVLSLAGVSTYLYVGYFNFGRQLYKLTQEQGIAGKSAEMAAQALVHKYTDKGLDPEVLSTIKFGVFRMRDEEKPKT
jgi:hypothetical protein